MAYNKELDEVLWKSEEVFFKKGTVYATITRYNGGNPKVQVRETGLMFGKKPFDRVLMKRVSLDQLEGVITLLQNAKDRPELVVDPNIPDDIDEGIK